MNPLDSTVEPVGVGGGIQVRRQYRRRRNSVVTGSFFAWLKEETTAITAENFGIDSGDRVPRLSELRTLARTA